MNIKSRKDSKDFNYIEIYILALALIIFGLLVPSDKGILQGLRDIVLAPGILLTDYMEVGGVGAAFVNAGLVLLVNLVFAHVNRIKLNGPIMAGLWTVVGFSFFGKNLFNTIPLVLGVNLYVKMLDQELSDNIQVVYFSTGLAPLVSYLALGTGQPLYLSLPLALVVGMVVGFITIPLSRSMLNFHHGYNLYNIGFTLGIVGLAAAGILRMFGFDMSQPDQIYLVKNPYILAFVLALCLVFIIYGLYANQGPGGYGRLLRYTGRSSSDFTKMNSKGVLYINMGLLGLISLAFVWINEGIINGPVLGGIFTVMGFGVFGKHPRNIIPILIGVFLGNHMNIFDRTATGSILMGLFGTTLAPIAGDFGALSGILAGFIHTAIASNVGFVHGGMNLYNNGLAGGFVAGLLVPLLKEFRGSRYLGHRLFRKPSKNIYLE